MALLNEGSFIISSRINDNLYQHYFTNTSVDIVTVYNYKNYIGVCHSYEKNIILNNIGFAITKHVKQ